MKMEELTGYPYAESFLEGFAPEGAVSNGLSCWKASPYYVWWMYDLKRTCLVDRLVMTSGTDSKYRYFIQVSTDRINWKCCYEKSESTLLKDEACPINDLARYIRITFTYCDRSDEVQISSVKVFGEEAKDHCPSGIFRYASQASERRLLEELQPSLDIEEGWRPAVLEARQGKASLKLSAMSFGEGCNQMRGLFGFPVNDKPFARRLIARLSIRIDSANGPVIGCMDAFRQWKQWNELACDIVPTRGLHDVYLTVESMSEGMVIDFCWLGFVKKTPLPSPRKMVDLPSNADIDELSVYIGLLHSHTGFSDGTSVPSCAYDYARNVAKLDFLAITEHSNLFDEAFDAVSSRKFKAIASCAKAKTEDGSFVALYGSETTWYNQFGHMNLYEEDFFLNTYETKYNDVSVYYQTLKQYPGSINQWNHPWSCGNRHLDLFYPYDEQLDRIMYLIEINPYENPDEGGLSYYLKALENGYHVAPCGSQDNHKADWGTQNNLRTAIAAKTLTKASLIEAIRSRRVCFTCAPELKVIFALNGHAMGATIDKSAVYEARLRISTPASGAHLSKLELLGDNGRLIRSEALEGCDIDMKITGLELQDKYCLARVTLASGEFCVTSPVWIKKEKRRTI
jgi:hypothetical protein